MKKIDLKGLIANVKGLKVNKKAILITVGVLIVIVMLVKTTANIQNVLFKKKAPEKAPAVTFEDESIPVKVFKAKRIDFKDSLPCMGNIRGFKEIDLKFQVAGILQSYNFE